ncbi:DUF554 domain-containing protein [Eubacterium pyruvativorans]|uniref:DUF554 domain-containing protein n=1 Tax=Eubacterium pyruvativorans TaxID=155865 RepID=UPI0023F304E0|nr:DUF554 domain-containing protein [Eubacterium pyruvativorans]MCI5746325.1 DUF554 domain-containing protein [Eubacterium pyruvativorans]MDD7684466.1 DUF554 domain-containing protein [Eubacterium pyruvativorans]
MFAVFVNTLAILVGTTLGLLFRKGIPERISSVMMNTLALCVVIIGIQGAVKEKNVLIMILSCVIGVMIGEVLDLDGRINRGTDRIVARFSSGGNSGFTEAMIESTIIMSVGAMMIVGSLNAGLQHDYTMLYTKSLLDFITGIMLGATMGAGVYGSAVFTFLAQGLLVLLAEYIAPYLNDALILELSASGSLMILAIGTNMLNLTKFKVINMLPAFLVVPFALKLMEILGLS